MSTSILYHVFGLKGIRDTFTQCRSNALIFRDEMTDASIQRPKCMRLPQSQYEGTEGRLVLHEPHWAQEFFTVLLSALCVVR
jgi:hypothetical protein